MRYFAMSEMYERELLGVLIILVPDLGADYMGFYFGQIYQSLQLSMCTFLELYYTSIISKYFKHVVNI